MHRRPSWFLSLLSIVAVAFTASHPCAAEQFDLSGAQVWTRDGELTAAESSAVSILIDEVEKRTKIRWNHVKGEEPAGGPLIVLASRLDMGARGLRVNNDNWPSSHSPEAFSIYRDGSGPTTRIYILAHESRGVMYGVGYLLRHLEMLPNHVTVAHNVRADMTPDKALRGHQIGYRPRANSWDAWTVEQFEQYFRDMIVFGANAVENIPFQDNDPGPLMKLPRDRMNVEFSKLCAKYDVQHWVWIPIEFPLDDEPDKADAFLTRQAAFYAECPRLDGIFVPGGDPGSNPSSALMPYLKRMADACLAKHKDAKVWVSLQGFKQVDIDDFYQYVEKNEPDWLGGVVMGPSSPPLNVTRDRLPERYGIRWYPDITHNVRCQYPIPWLDPVWGLTVGREGVNPRPRDSAAIYENERRLTNGFITYSDGIHDDFNKNFWSALGLDPSISSREFAEQYARYFFRGDVSEIGADALAGLEDNLRGPAESNGAVQGTLALWQKMDEALPKGRNWRFDMHLFRAYCDAYTQRRLGFETNLEREAIRLLGSRRFDDDMAMKLAEAILDRADTEPVHPDMQQRIESLADQLFRDIGYQTSVSKYGASGFERGCMLDYMRYPLNNRWWIEDRFAKIRSIEAGVERSDQIERIVRWENPGPGSYYEALGHVGKSHHITKVLDIADVVRGSQETDAAQPVIPTQRNISPLRNNLRLSFHVYQDDLPKLEFNSIVPSARYTVRLVAQRESPLEIDGMPAVKIRTGDRYDQVTEQEFEVPSSATADGRIVLSWTKLDESHLNWRQRHYVTDLWILKQ